MDGSRSDGDHGGFDSGLRQHGRTESASSGEEQTNFSIFAGISALSPDNSEKPLVQQMNEAMGVTIEWNCVSAIP